MWQEYHAPKTLEEALRLLADCGEQARIVAGGTDLLVELGRRAVDAPRTPAVRALIDVTRIAGLDRIWLDDQDCIHVGPTVTHNQAVASCLLTKRGTPLAQACWSVGSPALRNRDRTDVQIWEVGGAIPENRPVLFDYNVPLYKPPSTCSITPVI